MEFRAQAQLTQYPCAYGKCKKPTKDIGWIKGDDRTIEVNSEDNDKWKNDDCSKRSLLKNYHNVEYPPLLMFKNSKKNKKIINLYPPPPLHLERIEALNKFYGELSKLMDLKFFEKEIGIKRSEYHGGQFEGNECKKIMNNLTKLESHLKDDHEELLPFVETMWFNHLLDELVNKDSLEEEVFEVIKSFENAYMCLKEKFNISITNKVHIIIDHLSDYLKENKTTLRSTTDQTIESTHSKLDKFLRRHGYFRKDPDSSTSGKKLLDGICAWNAYVLGDTEGNQKDEEVDPNLDN